MRHLHFSLAALIVAPLWMPPTHARADQGTWTPFTVNVLRSNEEDERIQGLEWASSTVPVALAPLADGMLPFVHLEALLPEAGWAVFWNNELIHSAEAIDNRVQLDVPLAGEYTQVELIGSRNVVNLRHEVVILHFARYKELGVEFKAATSSGSEAQLPLSSKPEVLLSAGYRMGTLGDASLGNLNLGFIIRTLPFGSRFRLGLSSDMAILALSSTTSKFFDFGAHLRFEGGGARLRPVFSAGLAYQAGSISDGTAVASYGLFGPDARAGIGLRIGNGDLQILGRGAFLSSLTDSTSDGGTLFGGEALWRFASPGTPGLFLKADFQLLDFGGAESLTAIQGSLGYSL